MLLYLDFQNNVLKNHLNWQNQDCNSCTSFLHLWCFLYVTKRQYKDLINLIKQVSEICQACRHFPQTFVRRVRQSRKACHESKHKYYFVQS